MLRSVWILSSDALRVGIRVCVKFDERALGGTSDESGEADGEKARGTQMGLPRVCTVRERAGMVVGLSSYG